MRARLDDLPPADSRRACCSHRPLGRPSAELLARPGRHGARPRAGARRAGDRAHATGRFASPTRCSRRCSTRACPRTSGGARTDASHRSSRIRSTAPATSRFRPRARTPRSPLLSSDAATLAGTRGAPIAAAELAEHALRLTPPARAQRPASSSARCGARPAQRGRMDARTKRFLPISSRRHERAPCAPRLLSSLPSSRASGRSVPLLEEALREAASRPALQSVIHCRLAWASSKPGFDHARRALELADELDDDLLRGRARAMQAILSWFAGEAEAPEDLPARVRDFPSAVGGELLVREATLAVVNTLAPVPKRDEARALLEREYEEWRERDEPRSSRALWGLAWVEFWAGRWALAAEYAARARDISVQYGLEMPQDHLPMRSSPSIEDSSTWPGSTRNEVSTSLEEQFRGRPVAAHGGPRARRPMERRSVRGQASGSRRPTGGPRSSGGASRVSAGGRPTTPSCFSRTVGSTTPFESSMSGRRMPRGLPASGSWRT